MAVLLTGLLTLTVLETALEMASEAVLQAVLEMALEMALVALVVVRAPPVGQKWALGPPGRDPSRSSSRSTWTCRQSRLCSAYQQI